MLTIIIPTKNEENYIGELLNDLSVQHFTLPLEIVISDNNSRDNTIEIVNSFRDKLDIKIVKGGLPAKARNNGVKVAKYDTLLFIDADVRIKDKYIVQNSLIIHKDYELLTCYLTSEDLKTKILYMFSNIITYLSMYISKPYATTMFFMVKKSTFRGFNEELKHCEDIILSRMYKRSKFKVYNGYIYTDNRRFKKTSYFKYLLYFINNLIHINNEDYFKKDIGYWS